MKILVAEDDPVQRMHLAAQLRRTGHELIEASDGNEAWAQLERGEARVLITDWMMPGLDGLEIIKRLRSSTSLGYVYVIILTAKEGRDHLIAGLDAGADDYLTKPFDRAELLARLRIGERILGLEARLLEMATRDQLTGALTRRAFLSGAELEMKRSERESEPFGLVMLDIDDFKLFNDQHGHAAGDEALRLVSSLIRRIARPYDLVCRWGGEEFIILLPGCGALQSADAAERMRAAMETERLVLPGTPELRVTASFGVSIFEPKSGLVLDDLVKRADAALYAAKDAGKNRVR